MRREAITDPARLPEALPAVLRRVYAARAVESAADLAYTLDQLLPPARLGGLPEAVELLIQALAARQRIVVVGDFDADGATSCALCLRALRSMGAPDVHYLVPNRFEYGYGLTPEIVDVAAALKPDLIMTVDNGISSLAGVAAARARGIRVLITDHHLPGEHLPQADAVVNPNLPGDDFPSKNLAGVGVAFYVMLALRAGLRERGWFARQGIAEPNLGQLLDLVALGTVADVVPLDRNNRILVQQGIQRIRAGRCVPGIRAILEVGGRTVSRTVSADLGFVAGPRLNAAGRLDDMSLGIECLLTDSETTAREIAAQLDSLNRDRKDIESGMQSQALEAIRGLQLDAQRLPTGLCLFDPQWHQGVIGILAARIKERFHRPVIAFARAGKGELKGSARSVAGLHVRDALDAVATRHPELISRFGGHAMGELCGEEFSLANAQLLRDAGPWGQGFPAPLFDGCFEVLNQRVVGGRHLKLTLKPAAGGQPIEAIAFNTPALDAACLRANMVYRLDVNEFRGVESAQLIVEYIEAGDRHG
jgi:single-stranded-DNA-specific exonuclease